MLNIQKQSVNTDKKTNYILDYFLPFLNRKGDKEASAKLTERLCDEFEGVFTGIGCFEGMFTLQIKERSKQYKSSAETSYICTPATFQRRV